MGGSSVEDDDAAEKRRSKKAARPKRGCLGNLKQMMCNKRIVSQRELFDKQVSKIDALSVSYREAALTSALPTKNRSSTQKSAAPSAGN